MNLVDVKAIFEDESGQPVEPLTLLDLDTARPFREGDRGIGPARWHLAHPAEFEGATLWRADTLFPWPWALQVGPRRYRQVTVAAAYGFLYTVGWCAIVPGDVAAVVPVELDWYEWLVTRLDLRGGPAAVAGAGVGGEG